MNTRHLLVASLAVGWWFGIVAADTVRLKTGDIYEGTILRETETNVSIEVEYARGTILSTEILNKTQITEIVRSTPEQLAQRAMERAYANTQRYNLDPLTSYTFNAYRLVIDGVLRRFLTDYPNSPYTNAVQAKLSEWTAEQGKVASGLRKYHGVWMRPEEFARRNAPVDHSKVAEPATTAAAQKDILAQVGELLSRYWVVALAAVVGMLWLCVHIFTRD
jgi:hypothetical protein